MFNWVLNTFHGHDYTVPQTILQSYKTKKFPDIFQIEMICLVRLAFTENAKSKSKSLSNNSWKIWETIDENQRNCLS